MALLHWSAVRRAGSDPSAGDVSLAFFDIPGGRWCRGNHRHTVCHPFLATAINDTPTGRLNRSSHRFSSRRSRVSSAFTDFGGTISAV